MLGCSHWNPVQNGVISDHSMIKHIKNRKYTDYINSDDLARCQRASRTLGLHRKSRASEVVPGFFFMLDFGSTVTLVLDLTWASNSVGLGSGLLWPGGPASCCSTGPEWKHYSRM